MIEMNQTTEELELVFPAANILELKDCYRIDIPAPAFKNHEVTVTLLEKNLTLTARKKTNPSKENFDYLRTMRIPETLTTSGDFSFTYNGGIFSIKLLKQLPQEVKV